MHISLSSPTHPGSGNDVANVDGLFDTKNSSRGEVLVASNKLMFYHLKTKRRVS